MKQTEVSIRLLINFNPQYVLFEGMIAPEKRKTLRIAMHFLR